MATDYISLLNLTYEIEGLLMLHINRGEEASPEMTRLLQEKIRRLAAEGIKDQGNRTNLTNPIAEAAPTTPDTPISATTQATQTSQATPISESSTTSKPSPITPISPIPPIDTDEYNDDFSETEATPDQEAIAVNAIEEETEDANTTVDKFDTPATKISTSPVEELPTIADTTIRLEEKLARDRARDIFKAFTINDKFRFRRELFRNSQEEFDETLYVIAQMNNFDEAEEYFYNDLCWNPESEDVKEFMDVVKKHF